MANCVGFSAVLLVGLTIFMYCTPVHSALLFSRDPCPKGIGKDDTWYPDFVPGSSGQRAECMSCSCNGGDEQGFVCASCGRYMMRSPPNCYTAKSSPHLHYPDCCDVEVRCPGHPKYDPSKASNIVG